MGSPNLVPIPREGDTKGIIRAIAKLASLRLNADSTPTFASLTLSGLSASRLLATNSSSVLVSSNLYSWVTETSNQVLIADDGDGTITLSLPQDIHTGATPTFADLTLSSPSNIYGLSHDSFADFVATEHLDHALNQDANLVSWVRGYLSGTDAVDEAGGTTWTKAGNATNIDAGVIGPALTFDGTGDWFTDATPDSFPTGTSARTICMRIKKKNAVDSMVAFSYGGAANGTSFTLQARGTGQFATTVAGGNVFSTSTVLNDLKWHTIAVTFDPDDTGFSGSGDIRNAKLYVDGIFTANITSVEEIINTTNEDAFIGVYRDATILPYNGEIDELRIYSRVLNADEILEVHQLGTLDAMTTFDAAYFKKYIASRSGYFNNLNVSGIITANTITANGLTVTGGLDIDINASNLINVGNILPKDDVTQTLGSAVKSWHNIWVDNVLMNDGGQLGIGGGPIITFDSSNSFFEFTGGKVGIGITTPTLPLSVMEKSGHTAIGGFAIKLTNKTGGNTVAGELVGPYSATAVDDAFKKGGTDSDEVFGIVLDTGVADGSEAWIVVSGIANVLMDAGGSARGDRIISSTTVGSADVWNVGGAVDTHFQEIGHCIETRTGAGLARCILHFN